MRSSEKKKSHGRSSFLRALSSFNKKLYRSAQRGVVGRYLTGYDAACERFENTKLRQLLSKVFATLFSRKPSKPERETLPPEAEGVVSYQSESLPKSVSHRFAAIFDDSLIVSGARAVKSALLNTPMVTYGLMLFGFALFFLIAQALVLIFSNFSVPLGIFSYVTTSDTVLTVTYMASAVILMALSLILVFVQEGSLYAFAVDSKLLGSILRTMMGIKRVAQQPNKTAVLRRKEAFVIGMVLGTMTFFVTPYRLFMVLLVLLLVAITVNIPEFGLVLGVLVLPYLSLFEHPTLIAFISGAFLMMATLLKLVRGKRTLRTEPLDGLVGLFLLLIFFGGIVTVGGFSSFESAVSMTVLGALYFAVIVLVRDMTWFKRVIGALMLSSIPIALLAIAEFILGKTSTLWQDMSFFSEISGRATSLWGNPNILAEYLLVTFFVSLGALFAFKRATYKTYALSVMLLNAAALVFTWSRGAWIAFAAALVVFFLLYSHKALPWIVLSLVGFAVACFFMPEAFIARLESIVTFSDSSTLYRVHIWQGCARMIRDIFLTGIGVGEGAFAEVYPSYALPGIEAAPHAHNLLMQIVIELGIVGLLIFLLMILTAIRAAFTLFAKCTKASSEVPYGLGAFAALLALLIHGVTDYIWYNHRIFALFFLLLGLIRASRTIGMNALTPMVGEPDAYDIDIELHR